MKNQKRHRILKRLLIIIGAAAAACIVFLCIYGYATAYKPEAAALSAMESSDRVKVTNSGNEIFFDGEGTEDLFIFYPGARVSAEAYAPVMRMLADDGVDCVIVKMPFNLAFFGMNSAGSVIDRTGYNNYFIGGHSLGGVAAGSFAAKNDSRVKGLILLASYCTDDLRDKQLGVLSIYGSEDGVLNFDAAAAAREKMPVYYIEECIEGGNHAQFGAYGHQKGDKEAKISAEEQWEITESYVLNFITG